MQIKQSESQQEAIGRSLGQPAAGAESRRSLIRQGNSGDFSEIKSRSTFGKRGSKKVGNQIETVDGD